MDTLRTIALTLIIVGAVNWGLVGLFNFDLVPAVFGGTTTFQPSGLARIVYLLIAVSGIYALSFYRMGEDAEAAAGGEDQGAQ